MDEQSTVQEVKDTLNSFLEIFNKYSKEIFGAYRSERLDSLRTQLQKQEPQVTNMLLQILGDGTVGISSMTQSQTIPHRDLLPTALMGGNNEISHNFYYYEAPVINLLYRALGTIDAGLWPAKEPTPILVIKDDELRSRCSDLLSAPGLYDRVIRESTTILEDRIRNKCPHETLARLIPNAVDQSGEKLINKVFSPDHPVLSISTEKPKRIAFHKILVGMISFLRNPYHHHLDETTEWSWAWSIVGFIDRLLADIDSCTVFQ